jgi:hypothetical protein
VAEIGVLLLLQLFSSHPVVINEVMANPRGLESEVSDKNEFIEIHNVSMDEIDLSSFYLECGRSPGIAEEIWPWEDTLLADEQVLMNTTVIPAQGYGLILPGGYVDSSAHPQPYDLAPGAVVLTIGTKSFGSGGLATSHHVWLYDSDGNLVDTYGSPADEDDDVPFDPGEGLSVERIDPEIADVEANWAACGEETGSTPGGRNSHSMLHDLSVASSDIAFYPSSPMVDGNCEVSVKVRNSGRDFSRSFDLALFCDRNLDFIVDAGELIESRHLTDALEPLSGQMTIPFLWTSLAQGDHRLVVRLVYEPDEDTSDNEASRWLRVGSPIPSVIINEIMYDPLANEPQWIELYNRSTGSYLMDGFEISDEDTDRSFGLPTFSLDADAYCVITASISGFTYSRVTLLVEPQGGFPHLNQTRETIYLRSVDGFVLDTTRYTSSMGGGPGVSLERVSPDVSGADEMNWSGCVDGEGATPGRRNSLWTGAVSSGSLNSAPSPFFPNGDGREDFTVINYSLPYTLSRLRIMVFDAVGHQMRSLVDGELVASKGSTMWDGRDANGVLVPSGIYIIYLEASDCGSAQIFAKKGTVVVGRM